jgi:predicted nucleic acid-binding protein
MRIYLDTCSLQRPLDSKTQLRIILEAEAVLGVLALCEAGTAELISSEALTFETLRNPNPVRREYALAALSKAKTFAEISDEAERRAKELAATGLRPLDALHLALAEQAQADCFCTCDDRLLRHLRVIQGLLVKVVTPIELAEEIDK